MKIICPHKPWKESLGPPGVSRPHLETTVLEHQMSLPWANFGTLQEDDKRACSNLCFLKHFTFRIRMSFFSFLPSPGSILGNLANCLPCTVGDPETHPDFSVLD